MKTSFEENPFEDPQVAKEWIASVENEEGKIRDTDIYPMLTRWVSDIRGTVVDIGCGQGICSEKMIRHEGVRYVGIDPSVPLVHRAQERYPKHDNSFAVGNAYELPLEDASVDGCVSINVWFHLEDIAAAAQEMSRVLKPAGRFFLVTANPDAYKTWERFYSDIAEDGKKIVGKAEIPINPLSRNTLYRHSKEELFSALQSACLVTEEQKDFGGGENLFLCVTGRK